MMIESGKCTVNDKHKSGRPIIHYAVEFGRCEILKYLIKAGADTSVKDSLGRNLLECTIYYRSGKIANWLVAEAGFDIKAAKKCSILKIVIICGLMKKLKRLIHEDGVDIYQTNRLGDQHKPIHWAVEAGWLEIVKYLIKDCGVDVEAQGSGERTPLQCAVVYDHWDIMKWLVLAAGAKIQTQDVCEDTALVLSHGSIKWLLTRAGCGTIVFFVIR